MSKPEAPRKAGRPSLYTTEIADAICTRIMDGESLRSVCRDPAMPAISTVMMWVLNEKEFAGKYELARKVQAEVWFEDIVDIAATPLIGEKTTSSGTGDKAKTEVVKGDNVERSRLMVHSKQWALGRMNPKKFGDKLQQEHSGPDGGPIQVNDVSLTDAERADRVTALLDAARARKSGQTADAAEDLGAPAGTTDSGV
jgi:hypothetical protein